MRVLGLETSCDETGVALYDSERGLLADALFSQIDLHRVYGGVVPELASRDHVKRMLPLIRQVLDEAGCPPSGIDAIDEPPCRHIHLRHLYTIPLRALHSRNVANLFFAGRNISATHVAFASTRVMATCAIMGQAVGTAAAQIVARPDRGIGEFFGAEETGRLQQRLLRDDAFLPGVRNQDTADLARSARLTASGEAPG